MAKIVFMNIPGYGHVNPTLPIIRELVQRGVHVIYYNHEDFRGVVEATGAEFRAYPASSPLTPESMAHSVHFNLMMVTLLLLQTSKQLTPFMLAELRREQPDLVIHDSIALWGMQCARILKLPAIASITTFVLEGAKPGPSTRELLFALWKMLPHLGKLIGARNFLLKTYGQDSLPKVLFPTVGALNIVFTSRAFQPESTFIDERFLFVGPSINPSTRQGDIPFEQIQRKPLIYISLGTIHNQQVDFYEKCFQAFGDYPAQFVLSVGKDTDISALSKIPTNFIVRNQVPQLEVLQQADLFITHGGMNSIHEALYYGVPMVIVPQQMEQSANAKLVKMRGAGVVIGGEPPYGRVIAEQLRHAVEDVLGDATYQQAAEHLQKSLHEAGGYARAVEAIEAFLRQVQATTKQEAKAVPSSLLPLSNDQPANPAVEYRHPA